MKYTIASPVNVVEGEHAGHNVVVDAFGIDFFGRDPETAGWCHDCREQVDLHEAKPEREEE